MIRVIEHQWIQMSDGIRLSARLWIPEQAERRPVPVVLEYIPYRKRDSYRIHDSAWGGALASRGIGFARVDVRGTGDSEGFLTDEYSERELDDGVAIIAWLAAQPWSNGRVGMRGISWGAINSLQIAARRPEALCAVMAIAGTDNRFTDDAHYLGGLYGRANLEWGVAFKSVLAAPPDPAVVGDAWRNMWQDRLDATPAIISEWSRHQTFDAYWQRGSIALDYRAITAPVYLVAGWLDTYVNPIGRLLEGLEVPVKGLIGCWGHTYPETATPNGLDWIDEEVRWWRQWLVGQDTGIMEEPQLWLFQPDAAPVSVLPQPVSGRWLALPQWPPAQPQAQRLWLNRNGLATTAQPGGVVTYVADDPVGATRSEWLNLPPAEQSADDARSLVFESPPLDTDLALLGYPSVTLTLKSTHNPASISVRLNVVDDENRAWPVSWFVGSLDWLQKSGGAEPAAEGYARYSIPLMFAGHLFRAGQRIRLAIAEGLWPMTLPTVQRSTLSLRSGESWMDLPLLPAAVQAAELPLTALPPGKPGQPAALPEIVTRSDGSHHCVVPRNGYRYTDRETGTLLTSEVTGESHWQPGKFCRWQQRSERSWSRDSWRCRVIADCEVTATAASLSITERVQAYQDGKQIFERVQAEKIPRRHI